MPYISRKSRRFIFSFMGALCLCYLLEFLPGGFMLHNVTSVLYCAIAIAWIITVERRVPFSFIKGYLVLGGVCVTMLFILRVMKWDIFAHIVTLNRLIYYAIYTSFISKGRKRSRKKQKSLGFHADHRMAGFGSHNHDE